MIAVDLSKQQALDADPKAIQQINFTANLERGGNTRLYFILEEAKKTVFDFSQGTAKFCKYNIIIRFTFYLFYLYENETIRQFKCKAIECTA